MRSETRKQRYSAKSHSAICYPLEVSTVNFRCEENIGYLIRAAACFGARAVNIIGDCPPPAVLRELSGSTSDFLTIRKFSNPHDLLEHCAAYGMRVLSAELHPDAASLHSYAFDIKTPTCIVIGNEKTGVPVDILLNSEIIAIPMPGVGFCINAAQAANVILYEYTRQAAQSAHGLG
jgi:tRNA G18 (ribose-2'-O)-methylase SpoU